MQLRIQHMLRRIGLDPGKVPASNLVLVRSSRGTDLDSNFHHLADLCWPFHDHVIRTLHTKAILCLGKKAGNYVRNRLGAHAPPPPSSRTTVATGRAASSPLPTEPMLPGAKDGPKRR